MVDLSTQPSDMPVSLSSISSRQDISLNYLEQLFLKLRNAKLVKSVRGPGGGYLLAKTPSEISIGEIFAAVDENIVLSDCLEESSSDFCAKTRNCLTQILWGKITASLKKTLYSISLAEVCNDTLTMEKTASQQPSFIHQL